MLKTKLNNQAKSLIFPIDSNKTEPKWRRINYIGKVSYAVGNLLEKKNHCKPAFYCKNNLGKMLINCKDKIDDMKKCGVYKITCIICNAAYVGKQAVVLNVG